MTEAIVQNGIRVQNQYQKPQLGNGEPSKDKRLNENTILKMFQKANSNRTPYNDLAINTNEGKGAYKLEDVVRIMSWNVHFWDTPSKINGSGDDFYNFLAVIREIKPDILLLQENDKKIDTLLNQLTDNEGKNMFGYAVQCTTTENLSNTILSKYPFSASAITAFPKIQTASQNQRCFTVVEIQTENDCLQIVNTHLEIHGKDDKPSNIRKREAEILVDTMSNPRKQLNDKFSSKCLQIIAGDFNEFYTGEALKQLQQNNWQDVFYKAWSDNANKTPQWSSKSPNGRIDFILLKKNNNWTKKIKGCYIYYTDVSDHFPLIMDLDISIRGGGPKYNNISTQSQQLPADRTGNNDQEKFNNSVEASQQYNNQILPKQDNFFRVVSWNVNYLKGDSYDLTGDGLNSIQQVINELSPDILLMQNISVDKDDKLKESFAGYNIYECVSIPGFIKGDDIYKELNGKTIKNAILAKEGINLSFNETRKLLSGDTDFHGTTNFNPCLVNVIVKIPETNNEIRLVTSYLDDGNYTKPGGSNKKSGDNLRTEVEELINIIPDVGSSLIGISYVSKLNEPSAALNGSKLETIYEKTDIPQPYWTTVRNGVGVVEDMMFVNKAFGQQIGGVYQYYSKASNHLAYVIDILNGNKSTKNTEVMKIDQPINKTIQSETSVMEKPKPIPQDDHKKMLLALSGENNSTTQETDQNKKESHNILDSVKDSLGFGISNLAGIMSNPIIKNGTSPCPQADFLPCFHLDSDIVRGILDNLIPEEQKKKQPQSQPQSQQEEQEEQQQKEEQEEQQEEQEGGKQKGKESGKGVGNKMLDGSIVRKRKKRKKHISQHIGGDNSENYFGKATENKAQTQRAVLAYITSVRTILSPQRKTQLCDMSNESFSPTQRGEVSSLLYQLSGVTAQILGNYNIREGIPYLAGKYSSQGTDVMEIRQLIMDIDKFADSLRKSSSLSHPSSSNPTADKILVQRYIESINDTINMGNTLISQVRRFMISDVDRRLLSASVLSYIARLFALGMESNVDVIRKHLRTTQHIEIDDAVLKLLNYLRYTANNKSDNLLNNKTDDTIQKTEEKIETKDRAQYQKPKVGIKAYKRHTQTELLPPKLHKRQQESAPEQLPIQEPIPKPVPESVQESTQEPIQKKEPIVRRRSQRRKGRARKEKRK